MDLTRSSSPRLWQKFLGSSRQDRRRIPSKERIRLHGNRCPGLSADAVRSFITDSKPTYPQFEAWIAEQLHGKIGRGYHQNP